MKTKLSIFTMLIFLMILPVYSQIDTIADSTGWVVYRKWILPEDAEIEYLDMSYYSAKYKLREE